MVLLYKERRTRGQRFVVEVILVVKKCAVVDAIPAVVHLDICC